MSKGSRVKAGPPAEQGVEWGPLFKRVLVGGAGLVLIVLALRSHDGSGMEIPMWRRGAGLLVGLVLAGIAGAYYLPGAKKRREELEKRRG